MYQYDDSTAVATRPLPSSDGTPGWFSDGNSSSGQVATILRAEFMNMLQAELLAVLSAASIVPSKSDSNQLLDALTLLYEPKGSGLLGKGFTLLDASTILSPTIVGGTIQVCNNLAAVTLTLPLSTAVVPFARLEIVNSSLYNATIVAQGGDNLSHINASVSAGIVIKPGDSLTVICQGTGIWLAIGGTAELALSALFGASLSNSGYQKLPGGWIVQWGLTSVAVAAGTSTADNWTFPITFPNACLQAFATPANYLGSSRTAESFTTTSCNGFALHSSAVTLSTRRLAIGF